MPVKEECRAFALGIRWHEADEVCVAPKGISTLPERIQKEKNMGEIITRDYKDKDTVFVGILKGSFIFMSDLVRKVKLDRLEICFMMVSSYGSGTRSSGCSR